MFEERRRQLRRMTTLFDAGVVCAALLAGYSARGTIFESRPVDFASHIALVPLLISLSVFFLFSFGGYRSPRAVSFWFYAWAVLRATLATIITMWALVYVLHIQYVSRIVLANFAVFAVIGLTGVRTGVLIYFRHSARKGENAREALIIGTGNRAKQLAAILRANAEWGLHIVGHIDPDPRFVGQRVLDAPVLGTVDDITTILKNHVVDEVFVAVPRAMITSVENIARACEEEGIKLRFMADVFDVQVARVKLDQLGVVPLLTLEPVSQEEWKVLVKRILDLVIVLPFVPILIPLFAVIAIVIKCDSRGPVFFIQKRVGQNKRSFSMFKFRTMRDGAERELAQLMHLNEAKGPIFKISNDPRLTKVGRFLRRTSLDELPQLINVIRGQMSLVGPRPMSVRDVDLFDKGIQRKRFSVKPGLTCLWQVSGRSQLPFTKWLELDLTYIAHWSLTLDFKILFKTIPAVVRGTGAL